MTGRPLLVNVIPFSLRGLPASAAWLRKPPSGNCRLNPSKRMNPLEQAAARLLATLIDRHETYTRPALYLWQPAAPGDQRCVSCAGAGPSALLPGRMVRLFPVATLPEMPGDQPDILAYALRRLRYKLEYSAVGFNCCRPNSACLNSSIPTRSSWQKTWTSAISAGASSNPESLRGPRASTPAKGRPARLYRYRPDAVAEIKARRLFP